MNKAAPILAFATALSFLAGQADAQERPGIVDALAYGGSSNLTAYALSSPGLPRPLAAARSALLARDGLVGSPGEVMDTRLNFRPILTYDGNINGGAVGDSLVVGGLRFLVREDQVSKGGLLIGGGVDGGVNINLAPMTALQLSAGAWAGYAPEHDISKGGASASACLAHQRDAATRLRGCLQGSHLEYELGKTQRASVEFGISRAYTVVEGFNEIDISLRQERTFGASQEDQTIVSARHSWAHRSGAAVTIGGSLGTRTDGISMRERVHASVAKTVAGRPTSLAISAQSNRGGMFLGEGRSESIYSISGSRQVMDNLSLRGSFTRVKARHDFFDNDSFGLDVNYRF